MKWILLLMTALLLACESSPGWPADANLKAIVNGTQVTLTWPEPVGEGLNVTIFNGDEVLGQVEGVQTFTVDGLKGKTEYQFHVKAKDAKGRVSAPLSAAVTTADGDPPSWPSDAVLDTSVESLGALGARVVFTWPAAKDDTAVTQYRLKRGDEVIAEVAETTYTHQSVEVDGDYQVEAGDSAGNWSTDGPSAKVWANRGLQRLLQSDGLVKPQLMIGR